MDVRYRHEMAKLAKMSYREVREYENAMHRIGSAAGSIAGVEAKKREALHLHGLLTVLRDALRPREKKRFWFSEGAWRVVWIKASAKPNLQRIGVVISAAGFVAVFLRWVAEKW